MPCSRKKALTRLFFTITRILKFFFLFFYLFTLFFVKCFTYFFRREDEYDDDLLYEEEEYDQEEEDHDEEEEEEEEEEEIEESRYSYDGKSKHIVAVIVKNGEDIIFTSEELDETEQNHRRHEHTSSYETVFQDTIEDFDDWENATFYVEDCNTSNSDFEHDNRDDFADDEVIREVCPTKSSPNLVDKRFETTNDDHDHDHSDHHHSTSCRFQSWQGQSNEEDVRQPQNNTITNEFKGRDSKINLEDDKGDTSFTRDEKFLIFDPPKSEAKKLKAVESEKYETFEDTYTIGSTSKGSSDWRSSIPDYDPFSSSSRRSCPNWESYTVYQKYDQEMIFLDRISAQKLHETESLRSILVEPRSISQRIVHKLSNNNKQKSTEQNYKKSYYELEATYVAQVCLAWEALNWNYANFKRKRVSTKEEEDHGCPAYIAQQFQQLQVLLQRYIENEPYQRGRRPQIYARMRGDAPKLLHVPEYHDYEEEENSKARITTTMFLSIVEETIHTFMNFLKSDRKTHCQVLAGLLFKRRNRPSVDPTVLNVVKKHCNKKKSKVKEVQRSSCISFKKKKIEREEAMEILMALIDLEVVSRVLRMKEITQEQLQWCEDKMNKVKVFEGKILQRDSSPLFFPPHLPNTTNNLLVVDFP